MANRDSHVTIHMAASLDGFIARKDGRVDWLETSDEFAGGDTMDPGFVEAFLKTIDCYVMGSRTDETDRSQVLGSATRRSHATLDVDWSQWHLIPR
jgi:riboflavin biosynthesis pyrimidine reductase